MSSGADEVLVSRKHIEHVVGPMRDCFFDAETETLNGLLAAIGQPPMRKVGSGSRRRWVPADSEEC